MAAKHKNQRNDFLLTYIEVGVKEGEVIFTVKEDILVHGKIV
ncbi:hypothetical protein SLEP1_g35730 [Rubroshorea leprosula]|uniref:Uncharacterized protein n=1 Tax=Rubroshorea leprosula TaxID=152421 RepID=A0AAV5KP64_9ROSI|nr:hypothetical protein SLEP1_g35730 [Rubroshorea leprosula]